MKYWRFFIISTVLLIKIQKLRFFNRVYGDQSNLTSKTMDTNVTTSSAFAPKRLYAVDGFEDRQNDVVYGPPLVEADDASVVVFFPGDVQDYTENMEAHRDNKYHKQWNLESTADKLQTKFQNCHILVVKPSRMGFKTFSCFENFVHSNQLGVPEHTPNHDALRHLHCLITSVSERLNHLGEDRNESDTATVRIRTDASEAATSATHLNIEHLELKLIGFSKGCVVLNQLLHEFYYNSVEMNPEITDIVSKIKDMYWLDGGHSGGENTWITDKNMLSSLCSLGISIHVHVTPYQIRDDRRPWIKKEEKAFSEYLTKHGCKIDRTVHFEVVPPSILMHFDVINDFKKFRRRTPEEILYLYSQWACAAVRITTDFSKWVFKNTPFITLFDPFKNKCKSRLAL